MITNVQLNEYKELSEKVNAPNILNKLNPVEIANILLIPKSNTESLGDRITNYASAVNYIIPKEEYLICRIDGHHFSSFTNGFDKPFDKALSNAMVATAKDLHERFNSFL